MAGILGSGFRGSLCFLHHFPQSFFRHGVAAGGARLCSQEHIDGSIVVENGTQQLEFAVFNIQFLLFRLVQEKAVFFDLLFPENAVQEIGSLFQFHLICLLS